MTRKFAITFYSLAIATVSMAFVQNLTAGGKGPDGVADLWVQELGKQQRSVEFVSDGRTAGLQFDIQGSFDDGSFQCGQSLPDTHMASCTVKDDYLRMVVFSMSNEVLPDTTLLTFKVVQGVRSSDHGARGSMDGHRKELALGNEQTKVSIISGGEVSNVKLADSEGSLITPQHLQD